jgi:hypothetical protein
MPEGSSEPRRPSFAEEWPRVAELDALVDAFVRGDYARVRRQAPRLAESAQDEPVRRAALELRSRIEPDRLALLLVALAAALLVVLGVWWIAHGKAPASNSPPSPPVERVR